MQILWVSEGWLVLPTPFTNTSMSKMPNIYISTCKSQKGANMHAKNGSQQVWIQLYNFLVIYQKWHTSIRLRLQVFVASLQQIP